MLGDLKPGEKAFKEEGVAEGIFMCDTCACHYLGKCSAHPLQSHKVKWYKEQENTDE